jgi:hypothetical protein
MLARILGLEKWRASMECLPWLWDRQEKTSSHRDQMGKASIMVVRQNTFSSVGIGSASRSAEVTGLTLYLPSGCIPAPYSISGQRSWSRTILTRRVDQAQGRISY